MRSRPVAVLSTGDVELECLDDSIWIAVMGIDLVTLALGRFRRKLGASEV